MFNILENGLVGTLLPTNMAAAIQMYRDFLNFEQLQLLHYWYINLKLAEIPQNGVIYIV